MTGRVNKHTVFTMLLLSLLLGLLLAVLCAHRTICIAYGLGQVSYSYAQVTKDAHI